MPRYFIWTIGCQMNKAESLRIASYLDFLGYQVAPSLQEADLVVLNTCVVRQSAEDKVLGTLGLLKGLKKEHPNLFILVTGCFVDSNIEGLKRRFSQVDFFFKPGAYTELTNWTQLQGISTAAQEIGPLTSPSPCAFVPIIQGCNKFCSYCIVPYRRGREVSRPLEEVICEVKGLMKQGVREVTLLGQNVPSYGHDLPSNPDLADLLAELNSIDNLARIRFLTNHPRDMSRRLIEAMASLDKVCEHLELPIQSGDDDILKAMRRGYTVEQYRKLIRAIRYHIPQISLSTDIIVGFPGETEEQFEHTSSLLEEMRFDVVHVAAYSPRPGTIAGRKYEDNVPPEIKRKRLNKVEQLQANIAAELNSAYRGKTVEVLVEGEKRGKWHGRTRSDKIVFFENKDDCTGQLVEIRIEKTSPWALQGKVGYNN
ncbi:MAG: tRNA (N6-isopentenyl adenosine(37)-C2)-methylthiotransferase MiaB [Dehalococcoidia bacterium]|nr:tRNA (N6-isopentenyl adenosine(37)-C2)-methylthiotransferase MiaB [Dehalococcoidia bacterium]